MSDAYATQRFQNAVQIFRMLEDKLRQEPGSVKPKLIDAVIIDLDAAMPGLTEEDLGRALVFKAHVMYWRYLAGLGKHTFFDPNVPVDPRLPKALELARKGLELLSEPADRRWASATVKELEEYIR